MKTFLLIIALILVNLAVNLGFLCQSSSSSDLPDSILVRCDEFLFSEAQFSKSNLSSFEDVLGSCFDSIDIYPEWKSEIISHCSYEVTFMTIFSQIFDDRQINAEIFLLNRNALITKSRVMITLVVFPTDSVEDLSDDRNEKYGVLYYILEMQQVFDALFKFHIIFLEEETFSNSCAEVLSHANSLHWNSISCSQVDLSAFPDTSDFRKRYLSAAVDSMPSTTSTNENELHYVLTLDGTMNRQCLRYELLRAISRCRVSYMPSVCLSLSFSCDSSYYPDGSHFFMTADILSISSVLPPSDQVAPFNFNRGDEASVRIRTLDLLFAGETLAENNDFLEEVFIFFGGLPPSYLQTHEYLWHEEITALQNVVLSYVRRVESSRLIVAKYLSQYIYPDNRINLSDERLFAYRRGVHSNLVCEVFPDYSHCDDLLYPTSHEKAIKFIDLETLPLKSVIASQIKPRIAFISAVFGGYENGCRRVVRQTVSAHFFCFTDNGTLSANGWTVDSTPYHTIDWQNQGKKETNSRERLYKDDCNTEMSNDDGGGGSRSVESSCGTSVDSMIVGRTMMDLFDAPNNLENNPCSFNIAKYYKANFLKIPLISNGNYDAVVWIDGTVAIENKKTAAIILDRVDKGANLMLFENSRVGCFGSIICDAELTKHTAKYNGSMVSKDGCQSPAQDIDGQLQEYYSRLGYHDDFWKEIRSRRPHVGSWITNFIVFNLKPSFKLQTEKFLNLWYEHITFFTTQDQLSFSFVAQYLDILPYSLPEIVVDRDLIFGDGNTNSLFSSHLHGS